MAATANVHLQIPYEIGRFIASQVPYLDHNVSGDPWAEHEGHFYPGPRPATGLARQRSLIGQTKQGLILEVINGIDQPRSIHTRYGEWMVLGSSSGSFKKVFQVVQKTLNLKKIEELSNEDISYWAIQTWNGQVLEEPILANKEAGECFSYEKVQEDYAAFRKNL